jgi:HEAT repeat protein
MKLEYSCRNIAEAGHRGDQQVVTDALVSEDPSARATALGAASRLGIFDYKMLTTALTDESGAVRRRALQLATRMSRSQDQASSPAAVAGAVAPLLDDSACAEVAAFALGEIGVTAPEIVGPLERQARHDDDPLCREAAVAALGALGTGREAVLAATGDVATVRRRAVIALAAFQGPDVERALADALDDRDWQVRQAAEDLLNPPVTPDGPELS